MNSRKSWRIRSSSCPDDQRTYVDEVVGDLHANLGRIKSHGDRANRIVHDMLQIGRDTGEWEFVDMNVLVDQQYRLAYHSQRAADADFNLDDGRGLRFGYRPQWR